MKKAYVKVSCGVLLLSGVGVACSDNASTTAPASTHAGAAGMAGANGGGAGAGAGAPSGGAAAGAAQGGLSGAAAMGGSAGLAGSAGSGGAGEGGLGVAGGGAGGAGGGAGGATIELSDWQYYGRWNLAQPGKATTVNSGSHVTVSFNGTGLVAKFDTSGNTGDIPTVSIKVDEQDLVEKEIAGTLELASGLGAGQHSVTLFVRGMSEQQARWTPPLVSSTVFLGFTVVGGSIVPSARPKRVKLEFLGDSITEGVALHATGPQGQTSANWRTDGPRGYAALTAMKLGAEWRQVGFGRQGLTIVGNGGVPKAQDAFNWFYAGVPRDDWQPDVVVINQGTNDQSAGGATFAPLYASFLGIVRTAYPSAKIACVRPFIGAYGAEIQAQVQQRKAAGDNQLYYIDTAGWTAPADFTDGVHPNQAGSVKIANLLVTALGPIVN